LALRRRRGTEFAGSDILEGLEWRAAFTQTDCGRRSRRGERLAMRGGDRLPFRARTPRRRGQRSRMQPASDWRSVRLEAMSQRIILVTGANGGLGQAIARAFLKESENSFVWLGVHKATDQANLLSKEFSGHCQLLPLDVSRVDSWTAAIKQISHEHQRLDVLVNNAGL